MEIISNSPNKCWKDAMNYLFKNGHRCVMYQREFMFVENVTYILDDIVIENKPNQCIVNDVFFHEYPSKFKIENSGVEIKRIYSFGDTMFDQYEAVCDVINENDSIRYPMISITDPSVDYARNGTPKCLTYINLIPEEDNIITAICSYASSNMALFNLPDIYLLHNIHKAIISKTNKKVGKLIIHFDKILLWMPDWIVYKRIFEGKENE